jgi:hypothetical protein
LTLRFWELDYKAAALRMVSNAQVPPHAVENAVRDIWGKTVEEIKKGVVRPGGQWEVCLCNVYVVSSPKLIVISIVVWVG